VQSKPSNAEEAWDDMLTGLPVSDLRAFPLLSRRPPQRPLIQQNGISSCCALLKEQDTKTSSNKALGQKLSQERGRLQSLEAGMEWLVYAALSDVPKSVHGMSLFSYYNFP